MNKFLLLLLAHMIADYPLQTDWVFKVRYVHRSGILVHVFLQVLTTIVLLFPYLLNLRTWLAIAGIFVTHLLIDQIRKNNIWVFLLDQALHLGVIVAATLAMRGIGPISLPSWLAIFWLNNTFIMILVGFLTATFAGTILILFIKITWRPGFTIQQGLSSYEKTTGVLSRGLVFVLAILGWYASPVFYPFIIIPPMLRLFFWHRWREESGQYRNVYLADIIVGFIYTILVASITIICANYLIPGMTATA
jgi:hypothetical protein